MPSMSNLTGVHLLLCARGCLLRLAQLLKQTLFLRCEFFLHFLCVHEKVRKQSHTI